MAEPTHQEQIDLLRGRQIALVKRLSSEDALAVLSSMPVTVEEEQDIVADIQQRHILTRERFDDTK